MAFPTTSILDNFNRANESPLSGGGNWSAASWDVATAKQMKVVSNGVEAITSNTICTQYWSPLSVADAEAYADFLVVTLTFLYLACRITTPGVGTTTAYSATWNPGSTSIVLQKLVSGTATILQTWSSMTPTAGDAMGLSAVATTIQLHSRHSGVWSDNTPLTDSAVTGAGFIGLGVRHSSTSSAVGDNFGGGTVVTPVAAMGIVSHYGSEGATSFGNVIGGG